MFVYNLQMNKSKTSGFIRQVSLGYAEQQNAEVLHPELFVLTLAWHISLGIQSSQVTAVTTLLQSQEVSV